MSQDIAYITAMTGGGGGGGGGGAEHKSEIESTKDTPYLILMSEIWCVF